MSSGFTYNLFVYMLYYMLAKLKVNCINLLWSSSLATTPRWPDSQARCNEVRPEQVFESILAPANILQKEDYFFIKLLFVL